MMSKGFLLEIFSRTCSLICILPTVFDFPGEFFVVSNFYCLQSTWGFEEHLSLAWKFLTLYRLSNGHPLSCASETRFPRKNKVQNLQQVGHAFSPVIKRAAVRDDMGEFLRYLQRRNKCVAPEFSFRLDEMIVRKVKYGEEGIEKTQQEMATEVLGHASGYIKGVGYGPKPPGKRSTLPDLNTQHLQKELAETQEKLQDSEGQFTELKNEVDDLKNQLTQQGECINKLMAFMRANESFSGGNNA